MSYILKTIVRQAELQTTGTIFDKQTHFIAYADDINIVGRSLEAVHDAYIPGRTTIEIEYYKGSFSDRPRQNLG
jgi:hypothetical protein